MPLNRVVQKATDPNYGGITPSSINLSNMPFTGTTTQFNQALSDDDFVTLTNSVTVSNKTLLSPIINSSIINSSTISSSTINFSTINNAIQNYSAMRSPKEYVTISAIAANGTITFDTLTQSVLYYTSNASANFTLNFRGDATNTLNSILNVGELITVVFMVTNGATAFFTGGAANLAQVDGTTSGVTTRWSGGTTPTSGNTSSVDIYTFGILKTASTPTYTIFASQAKW